MKLHGLVAISLLVFLTGCSHKTDIVGKWKMDTSSMTTGKNDPATGMMKGLTSMFSFEFKKDNTFVGPMSMEGTYAVEGKTVTITTTKMLGMDLSKLGSQSKQPPQVGEISDDGKTITIHPTKRPGSTGGNQDMKLVRDTGQ